MSVAAVHVWGMASGSRRKNITIFNSLIAYEYLLTKLDGKLVLPLASRTGLFYLDLNNLNTLPSWLGV